MIEVGLISNPLSQQNRRAMPALRALLAEAPHVHAMELTAMTDLPAMLRELARKEVGLVAVSGGDGTVQAVMTELINGGMFETLPLLALLPAGMTNLIAHDVGLTGRSAPALRRLLAATAGPALGGEQVTRAVLTLEHRLDTAPLHGMFFGTAGFHRAVELARAKVHPLGAERHAAAAMSVGLALFRLLRGRTAAHNMWHGERMTVTLDGRRGPSREYLLLLATTLDRLILGAKPFWGEGRGGMRYTAVEYPPRRPARAILPVIRGRPRPWMLEGGYDSGRADSCAIELECPMVLDGEVIEPLPGRPVRLSAARRITFWRP